MCVKELEKNSLACASNRDLGSLVENPTPKPAAEPVLLNERQFFMNFWTPLVVMTM